LREAAARQTTRGSSRREERGCCHESRRCNQQQHLGGCGLDFAFVFFEKLAQYRDDKLRNTRRDEGTTVAGVSCTHFKQKLWFGSM
jgi:hypothetical protein